MRPRYWKRQNGLRVVGFGELGALRSVFSFGRLAFEPCRWEGRIDLNKLGRREIKLILYNRQFILSPTVTQ